VIAAPWHGRYDVWVACAWASNNPKPSGSIRQLQRCSPAIVVQLVCEPGTPGTLAYENAMAGPAEQFDDALCLRRNPAFGVSDGICLFGQIPLLLIVEISVRGRETGPSSPSRTPSFG
jgi:hypothetical protein